MEQEIKQKSNKGLIALIIILIILLIASIGYIGYEKLYSKSAKESSTTTSTNVPNTITTTSSVNKENIDKKFIIEEFLNYLKLNDLYDENNISKFEVKSVTYFGDFVEEDNIKKSIIIKGNYECKDNSTTCLYQEQINNENDITEFVLTGIFDENYKIIQLDSQSIESQINILDNFIEKNITIE